MKPSLIVHGGAWDIPDEAVEACHTGCRRALTAGWAVLAGGGALDAIEAAIVVLENEPVFDAGFGSHLNLDGKVECDAIVMDGATLRAGAAAALQRMSKNPIRLARKIYETCPHMMLVAEGAERYAKANGIALCNNKELVSPAEMECVGAVQKRCARGGASSRA